MTSASLAAGNAPATSGNQKFINAAYHDLLGRAPDSTGLDYWAGQLDSGSPRGQIAKSLTHSDEYFSTIVKPAYLSYLGRAADKDGLSFWISQMQSDLTDERLEASFIGSPEFYAYAGGTDLAWVDAMYADLLGRTADAQGETYWTHQLASGANRTDVSYGFAASLERERHRVEDDYLHYLKRIPDSQGVDYWVQQFANGLTNEDLIAGLIDSPEYYNLAGSQENLAGSQLKWINPAGGDWNDPKNWDAGAVPGPDSDVLIDMPGNVTITHASGDSVIRSLVSKNAFALTGGSLSAAKSIKVDNTFTLSNATLKNTHVLAGSGGQGITFTPLGGILDGVTANCDLDLTQKYGVYVHVRNGLTLGDGAVVRLGNVGRYTQFGDLVSTTGSLVFDNTETLGGNGTILLGNGSNGLLVEGSFSIDPTVTIGPGITLRGAGGALVDETIQQTGLIINQGKMVADNSVSPGDFGYDSGFDGGVAVGSSFIPTDTSAAGPEAAPANVYESYRKGTFSYTLSGLTAGAAYTVRLHFTEDYFNAPGQHAINAGINGAAVLTGFDIIAAAGGQGKPVVKDFAATADAQGVIGLSFSGALGYGQVNGIEILSGGTRLRTIDCGRVHNGAGIVGSVKFVNEGTLSAANGDGISAYFAGPMAGTISAGSGSTADVEGNLTLAPTATINVELGGFGSTTPYGRIVVNGAASLAGTLNFALAPGYQPAVGDSFKILTFGSAQGQFNVIKGANLPNGRVLTPVYGPQDLTLVVS